MHAPDTAHWRALLRRRNEALIKDCDDLKASLVAATIPPALIPYRDTLRGICQFLLGDAEKNIQFLELNSNSILEEITSNTERCIRGVRLVKELLITPIIRSRPEDALCLNVLTWVHGEHIRTKNLPVAFADGGVAVRPLVKIVPLYYFPSRDQQGLLFQPLHFHEFGHCLYALHKTEMDELVKELQEAVADHLTPRSGRGDPHAEALAQKRQTVVNRWYSWAQEFFCDAVGLTIGGPAYLYAFSEFTNGLSQSDFYLSDKDLGLSKHPITWLRIRLLARRAEELGLDEVAKATLGEWNLLAEALQVTEEHHGYYDDVMADDIHRIVGDMLIEANPRPFLPEEVAHAGEPHPTDSPVLILNCAWKHYRSDPQTYPDWESPFVARLLA